MQSTFNMLINGLNMLYCGYITPPSRIKEVAKAFLGHVFCDDERAHDAFYGCPIIRPVPEVVGGRVIWRPRFTATAVPFPSTLWLRAAAGRPAVTAASSGLL